MKLRRQNFVAIIELTAETNLMARPTTERNTMHPSCTACRYQLNHGLARSVLILLFVWLTFPTPLVAQLPNALMESETVRVKTISKAKEATVSVFSTDGAGVGAGVLISSDGYALTNYHVADPCGIHLHCGLDDGKLYDAVIVGIDPVGDLAMIKLLGRNDFPVASIGDSDTVSVGDTCYAIGNPFLLATDFQPTVTMGIISGVHRYQFPAGTLLEYPDCLQTDAAINPGNSGGPLFNEIGELIGINGRGSFEKRGRVNVGVGYAISINQALNFSGTLRAGGVLDHASMGAVVATASDRKVRVTEIDSTSDAYRKGLRYDDEIIEVAGRKIGSSNDLKNILGTVPPHWKIPIKYRNAELEREVVVQLTSVHSRQELLKKLSPKRPSVDPDGDKPRENKPSDDPDGENSGDGGRSIPKKVLENYQRRRGFANYFFHNQERDRVLKGLRKSVQSSTPFLSISLQGKTKLDPFVAVLQSEKSGLKIGDDAFTISSESALEYQTRPKNSGGFLNLLTVWEALLFNEQRSSNESDRSLAVRYIGTAPFVAFGETDVGSTWSKRKQLDVLRVSLDGTKTDFYLNEKFQILAAEYFPFPEADGCVVEFSNYGLVNDFGQLPQRLKVVFRQKLFAEIDIESYSAKTAAGASASRNGKGEN